MPFAPKVRARLEELTRGVASSESGTALAALAELVWPRAARITCDGAEVEWAGRRLEARSGAVWCVAVLSNQFHVIASLDDVGDDPRVFVGDLDELDEGGLRVPLSTWLESLEREVLSAPPGVTPESASANEGRVLLRVRGDTTDPDERTRLNAMAARLGLGEIAKLRIEWGDSDLTDLLRDERLWRPLFSVAERRGRYLEAETSAALKSSDEGLRVRAIEHLGRPGGAPVPTLARLAEDKSLAVAIAATHALATTDGATTLARLVKDKRADVASAAVQGLMRIAPVEREALLDALGKRPADVSVALLEASGPAIEGSVDPEVTTLAELVAWLARAPRTSTSVALACDLTSPARAGRLKARLGITTTVNGRPQPVPLAKVLPHFARTLGVVLVPDGPRAIRVVEPPEGIALWRAHLERRA